MLHMFFKCSIRSFTITLSTAVLITGGCRAKTEKPLGVTADGKSLDPKTPNDERFLELFNNMAVIDFSKEPAYKKCTYKNYKVNPTTKAFETTAEPNPSTDTFTYDESGRKIKQIYEYGSDSFRSRSLTLWNYDSLGRVVKTSSGSVSTEGKESNTSHCVMSYDGDSNRLLKIDCYYGETAKEESKTSATEITYDLAAKKRTITVKKSSFNSDSTDLRLDYKAVEEHADFDFSLPINSTEEHYRYDSESKTNVLDRVETRETSFKDNKFSSLRINSFDVKDGKREKTEEEVCTYVSGLSQCESSRYNQASEIYANIKTTRIPVLIKRNAADLFGCPSPSSCNPRIFSQNQFLIDSRLVVSGLFQGVEGKTDEQGERPDKSIEAKFKFEGPYRPWMLDNATSESMLRLNADGKYSETKNTTSLSETGDIVTLISQARAENSKATSREALGDFENVEKSETECVRN